MPAARITGAVLGVVLCGACTQGKSLPAQQAPAQGTAQEIDAGAASKTSMPTAGGSSIGTSSGDPPPMAADRDATSTDTSAASNAQPTPDAGTGAKLGRDSLGDTPLPCDVQSVLRTSCQSCHGRTPGLQAPMALVGREDLLAPAITQPQRQVFELMRERTHSTSAPMPPAASRRLTDAELATLDDELKADIPVGPMQCDDAATTGATGSTKITYPAPDPSEIEHCYPLLAHNAEKAGDNTPYRVPSGESHACFIFDVPWPGSAQAVAFRSHQGPAVHHWILSDQTDNVSDGQIIKDVPNCNFGAQKLYGVSAINQQSELNMPPDVGLQMPSANSGVRLMLAFHYYNPGDPTDDSSGVEICLAKTPRPQTASIAELGVDFLTLPPHQQTDIVSNCKPTTNNDIHVLRSFPHMHARGTALDTIIHHADGSSEPLIDVPFDFNNQIAYDLNTVLHPGDTLLTTCHFNNDTDRTIFDGESTNDEMCINFITAWPAGSLATKRDTAGAEACFE